MITHAQTDAHKDARMRPENRMLLTANCQQRHRNVLSTMTMTL